jgi:hypothetical protein
MLPANWAKEFTARQALENEAQESVAA